MKRATIQTDIGEEIQCAKCEEFWPNDAEFFFITKGKPHSWCKACYFADPKVKENRARWATTQAAKRKQTAVGTECACPSIV